MLMTKIEAAMALGISIELLEYFTKEIPQAERKTPAENFRSRRAGTLRSRRTAFLQNSLSEPWQYTTGQRPRIPDAIKKDIKAGPITAARSAGIKITARSPTSRRSPIPSTTAPTT